MALRHFFPGGVLPELRRDAEPSKPPPVLRKAHEVSFRPNTDISTVIGDMIGYSVVRLSAAVGTGKSTKIPLALAKASKQVVVHALPSQFMALQLYEYLSQSPEGNQYSMAIAGIDEIPATGVVITTYAWVVSRMLARLGGEPFGKAILYADEAHESDCYSYTVRTCATNIPGVVSYVEASATFDEARMPMRETAGSIESAMFERQDPAIWDPTDAARPWSISELDGNVLVFLDDEEAAKALVNRYAENGVTAYRLHSRMDPKLFKTAMVAMSDPRGGIVALVADYSFRNGFTFDVSTIIDSGIVNYKYVKDGAMVTGRRIVFELEKYQACGRGGRTAGSKCKYFFPKGVDAKAAICALEGIEMEAAAVLLRVLGYAVPKPLSSLALMTKGNVPKDLSAALNGFVPLPLLSHSQMHSLVLEKIVDEKENEVVDILNSYGKPAKDVVEMDDLFAGLQLSSQQPVSRVGVSDILEQLESVSASAAVLEYGHYYSCAGVDMGGAIPGGTSWESMLETIHGKPLVVTGFTRQKRSAVIGKFLLEYNSRMLHGAAMARVLADEESLVKVSTMYPDVVKRWAAWLTHESREKEALANSLLKAMEILRDETFCFIAIDGDAELERETAEEIVRSLKDAVEAAKPLVDTQQFFAAIRDNTGRIEGPELPALMPPGVVSNESQIASLSSGLKFKPVSVGGVAKYLATFTVRNPLAWNEEAYADALVNVLEHKGVSHHVIHRLTILGSRIDCERVMGLVRNRNGKRKKPTLNFAVRRRLGGS